VYGVSFLVLAVNSAIADFFILKRRRAEMPLYSVSYTFVSYAVFFVLILALFSYGYWRIQQQRPGNPVRVSIIQGNIEQDKKWELGYQDEVMRIYKELTTKAVASNPSW